MTDRELQSLRNMGNECEEAADEIERLRARLAELTAQRTPLTEDQIAQISAECALVTPDDVYFARAIERAHGIGGKA